MKEMFTFQNLPMVIVVVLIAISWFSLLTVLIAG
ncbi:hypothetical protein EDC23_0475 [Thiohalophilus thiocyanatoxydans]|uniref:Uncharacterized protein n=1 Tax=Thiohalophilus thiocyanatoxydans TaxID=381308 RepID=A0A4R8J2L0_9GAMM|nr:hypothetical protein EDC23_0475 [Thiohalophilus thiocyanatoxydans]